LAVARRNTGGKLVETGVFRVSAFESEMMIGLAANDEYWGGRIWWKGMVISARNRGGCGENVEIGAGGIDGGAVSGREEGDGGCVCLRDAGGWNAVIYIKGKRLGIDLRALRGSEYTPGRVLCAESQVHLRFQ
jgi:hypothetical protein